MKLFYCSKSWTDINIDFQSRTIRHCCKSMPYQFPKVLTEEFISKSANIRARRIQSVKNIKHSDCINCWNDYTQGKSAYRDWANTWSSEQIKEIKKMGHGSDTDKFVYYVEIKTDNICDMSCIYCSPFSSSKISQEENYPIVDKTKEHDYEVFKSWIKNFLIRDDLVSKEIVFVFIGGEPTASSKFYDLIDYIEEVAKKSTKKVRLEICTNCNSKSTLMNKMLDRMNNSICGWGIGISNESFMNIAEQIRHNLDWNRFSDNFIKYIQHPSTEMIILSPTINIFNLSTFHLYINWVHDQFSKYAPTKHFTWYGNFISNVKELDVCNLPNQYKDYIKLAQIAIKSQELNSYYFNRENFSSFLDEMYKRVGSNYKENYKELAESFLLSKQNIKKTTNLIQLMKTLDL